MAQNQVFRNKTLLLLSTYFNKSTMAIQWGEGVVFILFNQEMVLGHMDIHWQTKNKQTNKKLTLHYTKR